MTSIIQYDFHKLCNDIGVLCGVKTYKYYFKDAMLRMRTRDGYTHEEWFERHKHKPYIKKTYEYKMSRKTSIDIAKYEIFQLYNNFGSFNGFSPKLARDFYKRYSPARILDPCAGFGGRCLGAISLDIDYIGYDTNISLKECYDKMLTDLSTNATVDIFYEDSCKADFTKYEYDMVFTSPPYFHGNASYPQERYEYMPDYKNGNDWRESFLYPMVKNAWNGLSIGGRLCLNIPEETAVLLMIRFLTTLGKYDERIDMPRRRSTTQIKDYIYVWKKSR